MSTKEVDAVGARFWFFQVLYRSWYLKKEVGTIIITQIRHSDMKKMYFSLFNHNNSAISTIFYIFFTIALTNYNNIYQNTWIKSYK